MSRTIAQQNREAEHQLENITITTIDPTTIDNYISQVNEARASLKPHVKDNDQLTSQIATAMLKHLNTLHDVQRHLPFIYHAEVQQNNGTLTSEHIIEKLQEHAMIMRTRIIEAQAQNHNYTTDVTQHPQWQQARRRNNKIDEEQEEHSKPHHDHVRSAGSAS